MFDRFIVASDLSVGSYAMVESLGGLKPFGAKHCLLLGCLSLPRVASVALSYDTTKLHESVGKQREMLEKLGYAVETQVVPGLAAHWINVIAADKDYPLIVTGSYRHSLVESAFPGNVADHIMRLNRKPTLFVRLVGRIEFGFAEPEATWHSFGNHVLFPTDFTTNAEQAFAYLEQLATRGVRQITLLHVQEDKDSRNELKLERLAERLQKICHAIVSAVVRHGSPVDEIMRMLKETRASLVVMGSRGCGFVSELTRGSVSHDVARNADAAVLLIPSMRSQT